MNVTLRRCRNDGTSRRDGRHTLTDDFPACLVDNEVPASKAITTVPDVANVGVPMRYQIGSAFSGLQGIELWVTLVRRDDNAVFNDGAALIECVQHGCASALRNHLPRRIVVVWLGLRHNKTAFAETQSIFYDWVIRIMSCFVQQYAALRNVEHTDLAGAYPNDGHGLIR